MCYNTVVHTTEKLTWRVPYLLGLNLPPEFLKPFRLLLRAFHTLYKFVLSCLQPLFHAQDQESNLRKTVRYISTEYMRTDLFYLCYSVRIAGPGASAHRTLFVRRAGTGKKRC